MNAPARPDVSVSHHPIVRLKNGRTVVDLKVDELVVDSRAIRVPDGKVRPDEITSLQLQVGQHVQFLVYSNSEVFRLILSGRVAGRDARPRPILHANSELSEQPDDYVTARVQDRQYAIPVRGVVQEVLHSEGVVLKLVHENGQDVGNKLTLKFTRE